MGDEPIAKTFKSANNLAFEGCNRANHINLYAVIEVGDRAE